MSWWHKVIKYKTKAQSWSIDITLGVIVFLGAFFIFYGLLSSNPNTTAAKLREQASGVINQVASDDSIIRVIDNDEINESKLNELKNLRYDELKGRLRVEGDFCIYLEDDKGYIVLINNTYRGIGAPTINISGTPCDQK